MANPEHLKMLKLGVEAWNRWRRDNTSETPDLSGADLNGAHLSGADLSSAKLSHAVLRFADLGIALLTKANLNSAQLEFARLYASPLNNADLRGAFLRNTDLSDASLYGANLDGANLNKARILNTEVGDASFREARFGQTVFVNTDLSRAIGLETAQHSAPSTIGIDTLYKSQGCIPDGFLRDAGVPEEIIDIARSIRAGPPIQWHSCFISYSTKDEEFARRLHTHMRQANMRVWFAPEDLKGGRKLHEQLFDAIQIQDRLLLVLSEHSIKSEWVMTEIRRAREVEKKEKRRKLFPIRLVDFDTLRNWTCFDADTGKDLPVEVREYFIPDFSNWKDHDAFETSFAKLQKDLKSEGKSKNV